MTTVVLLAEEVEMEEEVEIGVYAVPVLRVMVLVEAALVMLPVADELEELLDAPEMWNGKEYWKILASESRVSWNP